MHTYSFCWETIFTFQVEIDQFQVSAAESYVFVAKLERFLVTESLLVTVYIGRQGQFLAFSFL